MESIITASASRRASTTFAVQRFSNAISSAELFGRQVIVDLFGILGTQRARLRDVDGKVRRPLLADLGSLEPRHDAVGILAQEEQIEDSDGAILDELQDRGRDAPAELVAREADDVDVERPDCHARSLIGIDDLLAFGGMPAHADARERDPMRSCRRAGDEPPHSPM